MASLSSKNYLNVLCLAVLTARSHINILVYMFGEFNMLAYIRGTVAQIGDNHIVLDNSGIGYMIFMPASSLYSLKEAAEVTVHTYMAVREDDVSLFGFVTQDELKMFKNLITVSGIGPKNALSILSSFSVEELRLAIAAGDAKLIASSKGIGSKTAQKIVVDLKDKISKESFSNIVKNVKSSNSDVETAVAFVMSTGVTRSQCMNVLNKADSLDGMDIDELIDYIFKNMNV